MGKNWKQCQISFSWSPKSLWMVTAATKLKYAASWKKSCNKPRQCIKKQNYYFAEKGPCSQGCDLSSSHVWMCELDWAPKNSMVWTVVLDKTLESPLDSKEIKPVNPKGNQPSTLNIHWKYWCWSWSSNTSATWFQKDNSLEKTLMLGKLEGKRRRECREWDGWMASLTQWAPKKFWASSRR